MARDGNSATPARGANGSQGTSSSSIGRLPDEILFLPIAARARLLNAKFAVLNREFVRFLTDEVEFDAEVDLTNTCQSYADNVMNLRRMYKVFAARDDGDSIDGERLVKKAKRSLPKDGDSKAEEKKKKLNDTPKVATTALPSFITSTPAAGTGTSSFGSASSIGGFGGTRPLFPSTIGSASDTGTAPKTSTPILGNASQRMDVFTDLSSISSSPAAPLTSGFGAPMKVNEADITPTSPGERAEAELNPGTHIFIPLLNTAEGAGHKRPNGDEDSAEGTEPVVIRGTEESGISDKSSQSVETVESSIQPLYFTISGATSNILNMPRSAEKADKEKETNVDKKDGKANDDTSALADSSSPKPALFGSLFKAATGGFSFGSGSLFGGSTTKNGQANDKKGEAKKTAPLFKFGGDSSTSTKAPAVGAGGQNLFASFMSGSTTTTADSKTAAPSSSLFGSLLKPTLSFPSFGAPKPPAESGGDQAAGGGDEGEYVPPKAEVVTAEEPGATFSVKCALFKLVEKKFEKCGIGMLHIKEGDGKKSLLVRAAISTGTIWVNALLDSTMKAERAADDKIRFTTPVSPNEIKTFLVRVTKKEDASKIFEAMQSAGAK